MGLRLPCPYACLRDLTRRRLSRAIGTPNRAMLEGSGTANAANSPCVSLSIPSVKYRVLASPPFPAPLPNMISHSPPGVLPTPTSIGIEPSNAPVVGSNALISLAAKLKLPTSRSPPNTPNPAGASASPRVRRVGCR